MGTILNQYEAARRGMEMKVAMQAIRHIIRDRETSDDDKLRQIILAVHSFENDMADCEWQKPYSDMMKAAGIEPDDDM